MPTYNLPVGFTFDDLHPPGGSAIQSTEVENVYTFTKGALSGTFELTPTEIIFPEETPPQVLTYVQAQLAMVGQPKPWEVAIDDLRTRAADLVGVSVFSLTAAQRLTVAAIVLWLAGGLDNELKVRPLNEWLRRRRKKP